MLHTQKHIYKKRDIYTWPLQHADNKEMSCRNKRSGSAKYLMPKHTHTRALACTSTHRSTSARFQSSRGTKSCNYNIRLDNGHKGKWSTHTLMHTNSSSLKGHYSFVVLWIVLTTHCFSIWNVAVLIGHEGKLPCALFVHQINALQGHRFCSAVMI